jgi:uncharacterized protein (TIGR00730 family)
VKNICVFAGSCVGGDAGYAEAACALVEALAVRDLGLIYGGGRLGLMGELADAALRRGISVTGVIPQALEHHELARTDLPNLVIVRTMHERQALMAALADAFVALPGGIGTLAEIVEALNWTQLGLHRKPVGLLNVAGYWNGLVDLLAHADRAGFVADARRGRPVDASDPGELLDLLMAWEPPCPDPRVHVGGVDA